LTEEALANTLHLACATTVAAGHRLGSFTGTSGIAVTTRDRKFELDADLTAEHCLFERQVSNGLKILSSGRTTRAPVAAAAAERASTRAAEERIEDVAESAAKHVFGRLSTATTAATTRATHASLAELVVALALFDVGEYLVGPCDFLELALGLGVVRIGIGVQLAGALAIGLFDFVS
jgi:hypothetical protein